MKICSQILKPNYENALPFITTTFTLQVWDEKNHHCLSNGLRFDFPYIEDKETAIEFAVDLEEMLCILYEFIDGEFR